MNCSIHGEDVTYHPGRVDDNNKMLHIIQLQENRTHVYLCMKCTHRFNIVNVNIHSSDMKWISGAPYVTHV